MTKSMNITEVRKALLALPEQMEKRDLDAIEVTRWGRKVLAIIPWDDYEGIAETREILADAKAMRGIRQGLKAAKEGRVRKVSHVRRRLGL